MKRGGGKMYRGGGLIDSLKGLGRRTAKAITPASREVYNQRKENQHRYKNLQRLNNKGNPTGIYGSSIAGKSKFIKNSIGSGVRYGMNTSDQAYKRGTKMVSNAYRCRMQGASQIDKIHDLKDQLARKRKYRVTEIGKLEAQKKAIDKAINQYDIDIIYLINELQNAFNSHDPICGDPGINQNTIQKYIKRKNYFNESHITKNFTNRLGFITKKQFKK